MTKQRLIDVAMEIVHVVRTMEGDTAVTRCNHAYYYVSHHRDCYYITDGVPTCLWCIAGEWR